MEETRTTIPTRSEVARAYTWNTESVFADDAAFEEAFRSIERRLPDLAEFKGHLGDSAATLADWVAASEQVARDMGFVRVYAYMFFAVDSTDQEAGARQERTRGLGARVDAAMAFAEPELLEVGHDKLRRWLK